MGFGRGRFTMGAALSMRIHLAWMANRTRYVAALLIVLLSAYRASACDTPVYRYAMYRWMPAPYELYYFCDGPLDAEGSQLRERIREFAGVTGPAANLKFIPVDLQQDRELANIPPDVKEAWTKRASQQMPWCLLLSPMQQRLSEGSFVAGEVDALIHSPMRQEVGRLLEEGSAGVYVLIDGDDAAATESAEQTVRGVVADIASGKVPLAAAPNAEGDALPVQTVQLGFVKLHASDPAEKWLIQSLLLLEPDLATSKEPRLFLIYGRGRALFSSLGKGIHRDNLITDIEFISGACSCTVKEQNPGVDLLMRYDWEAVAHALSEKFGTEEGSPYRFSGDALFPELVIPMESSPPNDAVAAAVPSDSAPSSVAAPPSVAAPAVDGSTTSAPAEKVEDRSAIASPSASQADEPAATSPSTAVSTAQVTTPASSTELATTKAAPAARPAAASPPQPTSAWRAVVWVGVGLLGTLVVLFGATFLVLRPR